MLTVIIMIFGPVVLKLVFFPRVRFSNVINQLRTTSD